jgi:hypothetical protein
VFIIIHVKLRLLNIPDEIFPFKDESLSFVNTNTIFVLLIQTKETISEGTHLFVGKNNIEFLGQTHSM